MTKDKKWLKITISGDPILVETVSDYLVGIHNMGVEVATKDEVPTGVITGFAEKANIDDEQSFVATISQYLNEMAELFQVAAATVSYETFAEEDWSKKWKQHFKPFSIVPGFVIKPTWEEYECKENEHVIEMDPGMAFGTGHHATTSLCLEFIQETVEKKQCHSVLDVGCGTGILTMAAALFGAKQCFGIDNCPDAVRVAGENIVRNSLEDKVDIAVTPVEEVSETYDLVVANIIHDVLASMDKSIANCTKDGGYLVLSGILKENQADSIAAIYKEQGFTLLKKRERDEWAALLLQKGQELVREWTFFSQIEAS